MKSALTKRTCEREDDEIALQQAQRSNMKVVGLVVRPLCKQVCSRLGHRAEDAIESMGVKVSNDDEKRRYFAAKN